MTAKRMPPAPTPGLPGQYDLFFQNDNARARRRRTSLSAPGKVEGAKIRSKVSPRDVPAIKAARRLHLTLDDFLAKLPQLMARGFPAADRTTGMFDLKAIEAWQDSRNPHVLALTDEEAPRDAREVVGARLARM